MNLNAGTIEEKEDVTDSMKNERIFAIYVIKNSNLSDKMVVIAAAETEKSYPIVLLSFRNAAACRLCAEKLRTEL